MRRSVAVSDTTDEAEGLSKLLKAVEQRVDNKTGDLFVPTPKTGIEVRSTGGYYLRIDRAQSIASIQQGYDGRTYSSSEFSLADKDSRENAGYRAIRQTANSYWDSGLYVIDGTFGWAATPEDLSQAVIEQVEFRWNRRTGMQHITGFDGAITMDGGYAWLTSSYDVIMAYKVAAATVLGIG